MTAVVSVPSALENAVGWRISEGRPMPTKEAPDVDRVYFMTPLFTLAGTGLFEDPDIEIQYFNTEAAARAWGEADIAIRRGIR